MNLVHRAARRSSNVNGRGTATVNLPNLPNVRRTLYATQVRPTFEEVVNLSDRHNYATVGITYDPATRYYTVTV